MQLSDSIKALSISIGCFIILNGLQFIGIVLLVHWKYSDDNPSGYNLEFGSDGIIVNNQLIELSIYAHSGFEFVLLISGTLSIAVALFLSKRLLSSDYLNFSFPSTIKLLTFFVFLAWFVILFTLAASNLKFMKSDFLNKSIIDKMNMPIAILAIGVILPLAEELIFRGLIQRAISDRFGYITGIVSASFLFTFLHIQYDISQLIIVMVLSLILGWIRYKYESVYPSFMMHAALNSAGLAYIYVS